MAKKPIPLPLPIEEKKCEECPKCPPVGAPAWMATFADMATLLMAFFVLILSFAEFNSPKFKMISGSLKNAFGVQRINPVVEQPRGTTVLELKFSPNPEKAVTEDSKEKTTNKDQRKVQNNESLDGDQEKTKGEDNRNGEADRTDKADQQAQEMAKAIQEALQSGQIQVDVEDGEVVMKFNENPPNDQEMLSEQLKDAEQALQKAEQQTGQSTDGVKMAGLAEQMEELVQMAQTAQDAQMQQTEGKDGQQGGSDGSDPDAIKRKAELNESQLRIALRQEIADGLVQVETRDDKVFITVGSGGSFESGSSDMTAQAREIMNRIAFSSMTDSGKITVTGHTDDVPIGAGSEFRDNWDLAAARSASVVREMINTGLIDPRQLSAVSMGESAPIADNTTADGREKNRRIEIEITYE